MHQFLSNANQQKWSFSTKYQDVFVKHRLTSSNRATIQKCALWFVDKTPPWKSAIMVNNKRLANHPWSSHIYQCSWPLLCDLNLCSPEQQAKPKHDRWTTKCSLCVTLLRWGHKKWSIWYSSHHREHVCQVWSKQNRESTPTPYYINLDNHLYFIHFVYFSHFAWFSIRHITWQQKYFTNQYEQARHAWCKLVDSGRNYQYKDYVNTCMFPHYDLSHHTYCHYSVYINHVLYSYIIS